MKRLRVLRVLVQPICVVDDGETLTELPVDATAVPFSAWAIFDLDAALAPLRAQVEGEPVDTFDPQGASNVDGTRQPGRRHCLAPAGDARHIAPAQPSRTPTDATDLASVISLANALRKSLLNLGVVDTDPPTGT